MASSGQLTIRPLSAMLEHSTNLITTMDPYCLISLGTQQWKSQVHKNGGKSPVWSDEALFQIQPGVDIIRISIFDDKAIGADKLIAEGVIPMEKLLSFASPFEEKIPLTFKAKPCGFILLRILNSNTSEMMGQNFKAQNFQPTYVQETLPHYQQQQTFTHDPLLNQNVQPSPIVAQNPGDIPIQDLQQHQVPIVQAPVAATTIPLVANNQLESAPNHHSPHGMLHGVNEHHGLASHDWKHKPISSPRQQGMVYADVAPNAVQHPLVGQESRAGEPILQQQNFVSQPPIVQQETIITSSTLHQQPIPAATTTTTTTTTTETQKPGFFSNLLHHNKSTHTQPVPSQHAPKQGFFSNLLHRNTSHHGSLPQQQPIVTSQQPLTSQSAMLSQAQPHVHSGVGTCTTCQQAIPSDYYQRLAMSQAQPHNAELINDHPKHYKF